MKTHFTILSFLVICSGCATTSTKPDANAHEISTDKSNITSEYELMKVLSAKDYTKWKKRYPQGFSLDYETGMVRPKPINHH